ncbi:cytochrome P450 [Amycolatopsis cihanbeyliensis]|uniref:Cytochrome P450 n=1 Tax=Amycolatopsis cihanbeyliensis TaxID=1128664 RepID=A0A542DCG8_AMYCI|nr:cytochrome P450 [Amycolatopsis cihanbeyliensis]TQJ00766.1 cytochrome P450 [Amycolatopsis cihanbeyliensis]
MTTGTATPTAPRLPPGPRLPMTVQTALFGMFRHRWLPRLRRRYGEVFRMHVYPERHVALLSNVEDIRTVFAGSNTVFHAGEGNMVLGPLMGEHSVLLTDEGAHLRARKLLMPAFHGAALRGYRDLVGELAEAEVRQWPAGGPLPTHDRMRALTLEVILRVVFGVGTGPRLDELRTRLGRLVEVGPLDMIGWFNPGLRRIGPWRRFAQNQRRVDELLYTEITERRQAADLESRADVLSRLLAAQAGGERLSDTELRDQLITLLLAGHETTATALAWAFHELARDPARQAKAAEAAADPGTEGDRYLEAVTKESMRLRPVLTEVARKLTEDVHVGGYRIPAGYTVLPSIALVHADPHRHREPHRFRPERFLEDGPSPGGWLPFGGGVRRCLGAGFALMEATVVLRAVLSHYRLAADRERPERPKARHITLVPNRGARVLVTSR